MNDIKYDIVLHNNGKDLKDIDILSDYFGILLNEKSCQLLSPLLFHGGEMIPVDTGGDEVWHMFLVDKFGPVSPCASVANKSVIRRNHG